MSRSPMMVPAPPPVVTNRGQRRKAGVRQPMVRRVNATGLPRFIRRYPVKEAMAWRRTDEGQIIRRDRKFRAKVRRWLVSIGRRTA